MTQREAIHKLCAAIGRNRALICDLEEKNLLYSVALEQLCNSEMGEESQITTEAMAVARQCDAEPTTAVCGATPMPLFKSMAAVAREVVETMNGEPVEFSELFNRAVNKYPAMSRKRDNFMVNMTRLTSDGTLRRTGRGEYQRC